MKQKLLILFTLLLLSISTYSQSYYEFKWFNSDKSIQYTAFVTYINDQNIEFRVKYVNSEGIFKVAKYKSVRTIHYSNTKYAIFHGKEASIIYSDKPSKYRGYIADSFTYVPSENLWMKAGAGNDIIFVKVRELNPKTDFTPKYLYGFFDANEEFYRKLFNPYSVKTNTNFSELVSNIHFIAIGDSKDLSLKYAVKQDIENFDEFLRMTAKNLNISYKSSIYTGDEFNKTAINKIKNITLNTNEVVILMYRGHGFRWADQSSDFPRMKLGDSYSNESYNFEELHNDLKSKNPRLLISIGDLCNNIEGLSPIKDYPPTPLVQDISQSRLSIEKIEKLLLKKGNIISASAKPGEVSYSTKENGYFTKSLLDALLWEVSEFNTDKYADWENVFNTAKTNARKKSFSLAQTYQNALIKIKLL